MRGEQKRAPQSRGWKGRARQVARFGQLRYVCPGASRLRSSDFVGSDVLPPPLLAGHNPIMRLFTVRIHCAARPTAAPAVLASAHSCRDASHLLTCDSLSCSRARLEESRCVAGSFTDEVLAGLSVTVAAATLLVALRVATGWWGAATAGALALEALDEARRCRWCCMVASGLAQDGAVHKRTRQRVRVAQSGEAASSAPPPCSHDPPCLP